MSKSFLFGAAASLAFVSASLAGFGGQIILGPLGAGSVANGNTTGANDDNDGFTSGDHFFFIWNAGDDAWQLDWPGGPLTVTMTYGSGYDLDLFLYEPGGYNDSAIYSTLDNGLETVVDPVAPAGLYYLVVDGPDSSDVGAYTLNVIPVPGAAGLLAMGGLCAARRRRA